MMQTMERRDIGVGRGASRYGGKLILDIWKTKIRDNAGELDWSILKISQKNMLYSPKLNEMRTAPSNGRKSQNFFYGINSI